jgi:hypothetical protein
MSYFIEPRDTEPVSRELFWILLRGAWQLLLFVVGIAALVLPAMWAHDKKFHRAWALLSAYAGAAAYVAVCVSLIRIFHLSEDDGRQID